MLLSHPLTTRLTKSHDITFLLALSCLTCTSLGFAIEPASLYQAKKSLIRYHDSGEYDKDIQSVIGRAIRYLKSRLTQGHIDGKKLAIVLDIDETSLSNYPNMVKLNFGGSHEDIKKAELAGLDPVILPTLKLYQYAKAHHIAVFFLTGRPEDERQSTIQNLQRVGYRHWDGLILKPIHYKLKSISEFKMAARKKIIQRGYDIVLNIGDQFSDLTGKYADKAYKLPNPFYFLA